MKFIRWYRVKKSNKKLKRKAKLLKGYGGGVRSKQQGIPSTMTITLKYVQLHTGTTGLGPFVQAWRTTSAYDVDQTGTGHQPLCFDQYSALYKSYVVLKTTVNSWIKTGTMGCACVHVPSATSAYSGAAVDISGEQISKVKFTQSDRRINLKCTVDNAKIAGLTREEYISSTDYRALTSASPSVNNYITTMIQDPTTTATTYDMFSVVYMTILFSDPYHPAQS